VDLLKLNKLVNRRIDLSKLSDSDIRDITADVVAFCKRNGCGIDRALVEFPKYRPYKQQIIEEFRRQKQAAGPRPLKGGNEEETEHPDKLEYDEHKEKEKMMKLVGTHVDEALWDKAKDASQEAFGKVKWPFVQWWYQHKGQDGGKK